MCACERCVWKEAESLVERRKMGEREGEARARDG